MKPEILFSRYKNFVFGTDDSFDVQKKIFLLITHTTLIIAFTGIVTNIILGLEASLTIVTIAAFLLVLYLHTYVRRNQLDTKFAIIFFLISVFTFSYLWFFNAGYNGNTAVLIFVYFIVIVTILPVRYRIISFIVYSIMIVGLVTIQFMYPDLITHYDTEEQRYIDLALGYFLYLILAFVIQNTILKNYDDERRKGQAQNIQLNELNLQLSESNNKLEESVKRVEELNASKDRFITMLSHDLRSPFHGLLGLSRVMKEEYDSFPEIERKYIIHQLNQSIEKMYAFLEEVLLWGRLQRGVVKPKYAVENIYSLLEQIISVHEQTILKKGLHVNLNCSKELNSNIDKELLSVVIRNLLSNAIKFSLSGKAISIEAKETENKLLLTVADSGIGITPKTQSRLFKIDEIITTKGTEGETGSGMGLILCVDILKKLDGKISVQSVEGEGSVFTVELPSVQSVS